MTMNRPTQCARPPRASTPLAIATSQSTAITSTRWEPRPTISTAAPAETVSSTASVPARGAASCTPALSAIVAKPASAAAPPR